MGVSLKDSEKVRLTRKQAVRPVASCSRVFLAADSAHANDIEALIMLILTMTALDLLSGLIPPSAPLRYAGSLQKNEFITAWLVRCHL